MINKQEYDDMIHLPRHVSDRRAPMSVMDRAAQFSPFAALTGYDGTIQEAGRLTDDSIELTEEQKSMLNTKLKMIQDVVDTQPLVTITYFQPDSMKSGGAYVSKTGRVKKIEDYAHMVVMTDGTGIGISHIYKIHGELFCYMDEIFDV